jgi:hypothetical protein
MDLCYWKGIVHGKKLLNTYVILFAEYPINTLSSITYILKLGGVFNSPTKTYKQSNTLLGVLYKHHGLNSFGLNYQRGIVNRYEYSMHIKYPL